ncbi:unnamed protein product, partial [Closterium sp. NIES-53]
MTYLVTSYLSLSPVCSGVDLLRNPKYNKGLAFTEEERNRLYLNGLLPAGYMSQDHQYRGSHLVFNDDIQGTASVALAGLLASLPLLGSSLSNQTILFFGAGEAGTGIAELLATAISREANISLAEARGRIWLVDSKGLVVRSRVDSLQPHKVPFAHDHPESADLVETIHAIRPTALIGVSGQAGTFNQPVCEAMAQLNEVRAEGSGLVGETWAAVAVRPVVFALSNPTSLSECTAEDAYKWTQGRAIFASGSPFAPVEMDGKRFVPGQGNNAYVFPGIGLGCLMCGATRMRDEMFLAAAEALAAQVRGIEVLAAQVRIKGCQHLRMGDEMFLAAAEALAAQGNKAYVLPGIGLGCLICGATRMRDEMFLAAAEALAAQVRAFEALAAQVRAFGVLAAQVRAFGVLAAQ